jgi:hypothetical protein
MSDLKTVSASVVRFESEVEFFVVLSHWFHGSVLVLGIVLIFFGSSLSISSQFI